MKTIIIKARVTPEQFEEVRKMAGSLTVSQLIVERLFGSRPVVQSVSAHVPIPVKIKTPLGIAAEASNIIRRCQSSSGCKSTEVNPHKVHGFTGYFCEAHRP